MQIRMFDANIDGICCFSKGLKEHAIFNGYYIKMP